MPHCDYNDPFNKESPMRAVLCKEWGGPDKLVVEDIPSPAMRPGAVRLAVAAAGINFGDLLLVAGQYRTNRRFRSRPAWKSQEPSPKSVPVSGTSRSAIA